MPNLSLKNFTVEVLVNLRVQIFNTYFNLFLISRVDIKQKASSN